MTVCDLYIYIYNNGVCVCLCNQPVLCSIMYVCMYVCMYVYVCVCLSARPLCNNFYFGFFEIRQIPFTIPIYNVISLLLFL
jgi:hypothetical protein